MFLKAVGVVVKKKNFFNTDKIQSNSPLRGFEPSIFLWRTAEGIHIFWFIRKSVQTIKIIQTDNSGSTRRVGRKCKFWALSLELCNRGLSSIRKQGVNLKNRLNMSLRVYTSKMSTLSSDHVIQCFRFFVIRNSVISESWPGDKVEICAKWTYRHSITCSNEFL